MNKSILLMLIVILLGIGLLGCNTSDVTNDYMFSADYKDVRYKAGLNEAFTFDVYLPHEDIYEVSPAIIYIHGGSFTFNSKDAIQTGTKQLCAKEALDLGYTVFSINYRLLDHNTYFPDNIEDVNDAVDFIISEADTYHIDINNIGVWGTSAGGYLALMCAYPNPYNDYTPKVDYVIDFYGISDLVLLEEVKDFANDLYLNAYGLDNNETNKAEIFRLNQLYSPVSYITSDVVPTFIVHGLSDGIVPVSQSNLLNDLLDELGVSNDYMKFTNATHTLSNLSENQTKDLISAFVGFLHDNYTVLD